MARPLRLEYEYALWHLTARGNDRQDIFRDDVDREQFLLLLSQTVIRFGWQLLAWVLMSNHYHLLAQTPEPNLSRGMHWLNGRYAQWFNRRHGRSGHLFQGRFHGSLVEKESYLFSVARYVVLNPVRAGLVANPADWKWSSYRQTAGLETPDSWLVVDDLLESFGGVGVNGCQEYVRSVAGANGHPSPWSDRVGQIYLGRREWLVQIAEMVASAPRSREHPRAQLYPARPAIVDILPVVARTFDSTMDQLSSGRREHRSARNVAAFIAFEDGLYRQGDIAVALGMASPNGVGAIVRRCRDALARNEQFAQVVNECRRTIPRLPSASALPDPDRIGFYDVGPTRRRRAFRL